jgi:hypothetical protein
MAARRNNPAAVTTIPLELSTTRWVNPEWVVVHRAAADPVHHF